jgi:hypothetical protein
MNGWMFLIWLTIRVYHLDSPQFTEVALQGLSYEIDFKKFKKYLQILAYLREAAGFGTFLGAPMIL